MQKSKKPTYSKRTLDALKSAKKQDALKAVKKNDYTKGIMVDITEEQHWKLKEILLRKRIPTIAEWVRGHIEND